MISRLRLLLFALTCACACTAVAREVEKLEQINRDMDVIENIFASVMRQATRDRVRISNVRSDYLAGQGVLVTMDVSASRIYVNRFNNNIQIDADIQSLSEIPEMVQEILSELRIAITPYEPEELEELRELRTEQRKARAHRRNIARSLYEQRKKLVRTTDEDEQEDIQELVDELKDELEALSAQEAVIDSSVEDQLQRLRELSRRYKDRQSEATTNLAETVAEAVCAYGSTFAFLSANQFVTVGLNKHNEIEYFTFQIDNVRNCQSGDIDNETLLARAYVYTRD